MHPLVPLSLAAALQVAVPPAGLELRPFVSLQPLAPRTARETSGVAVVGATSPENGYLVDGLWIEPWCQLSPGQQLINHFLLTVQGAQARTVRSQHALTPLVVPDEEGGPPVRPEDAELSECETVSPLLFSATWGG